MRSRVAALALTALAVGSSAYTPAPGRTVEIRAPQDERASQFGRALAQQRRWLAIGSPRDSGEGRIAGAVHMYRKQGADWVRTTRLVASDAATRHRFGSALALDRRRLVVGSPHAERNIGRVHVFELRQGRWTQETRLLPPEARLARFGDAVALEGRRLVVGAPRYRVGPKRRGAVFIYIRRRGEWELEEMLPRAPEQDAGFGRAVAISGNVLAVGTVGSVVVYEHSERAWHPVALLEGSRSGTSSDFGAAVAMPPARFFAESPEIVVGAYREQDTHSRQGAVYVFRMQDGAWSEAHRILSPAPDHHANFGFGLASGRRGLVVGETYSLSASGNPGEAWFLPRREDGFGSGVRLVDSSARDRRSIGAAVALGPAGIVVGEAWRDTVRVIPWERSGS